MLPPKSSQPHSVDLNKDPLSRDFVPKQVLIQVCLAGLVTIIISGSTILLPHPSSPGTLNHSHLVEISVTKVIIKRKKTKPGEVWEFYALPCHTSSAFS